MPFTIPNSPDAGNPDQAEPDKVDFDIITSGDQNVGVVSGVAIAQRGAGANMSVDFASGTVQVGGSGNVSVTSGNVAVTTADVTNPRFDLAVVDNTGAKSVVAGTASSNPVFPAIPANSVALAAIYVAAGVTSIVTANIVDKRVTLVDYALLAGKTGGQTLIGGTASGNSLTLQSTSHATRGSIFLEGEVEQRPTDATLTAQPNWLVVNNIYTADFASASIGAFVSFVPTVLFNQAAAAFSASFLFHNGAIFKNVAGVTANLGTHITVNLASTLRADTQTLTATSQGINDATVFDTVNSGTLTVAEANSLWSRPTVNTGATLTARRAVRVLDAIGTGAITTQVGIDIASLAKGTTNIGLRNASATVFTPPAVQSITAASQAITVASTLKMIDANASYTLTAAPTIADGQDGQVVVIVNTDSGTDVVTLQDQGTLTSSNLRLAATTRALGPRDSITLVFSSTVGDWVEVAFTNVL